MLKHFIVNVVKRNIEEITHLNNVVLKMQEENERLHKLLNEIK
jgi:hypothetical protein